jgi:recombination protein RecA
MAAVRAAHARDPRAWCAWIDPEATLYAPGLACAGIDLARLLVVRAPEGALARFSVKVAASRAFDVIVVDVDPIPGASDAPFAARRRIVRAERFVRKLAVLAEEGGAAILLLTDARAPRASAWPVALRVELSHRAPGEITLRVAKDRRGRVGLAKTIPFRPRTLPSQVG